MSKKTLVTKEDIEIAHYRLGEADFDDVTEEVVEFMRDAALEKLATFNASDTLSSTVGDETSAASTQQEWVDVNDKLPEVGETVGFIVSSSREVYNGMALGGKYLGFNYGHHEFSVPGHSFGASHWCKLPLPPTKKEE